MLQNSKNIGYLLIGFSIVLLLILAFIKVNYDKQSVVLCKMYQEENLDMENCPVHKSNTSWWIVSAFGIAFIILGAGMYIMFQKKPIIEEAKKEFKQIDQSKLGDEERKIYELIKNKSGSAYQTDLIKESEFGKVKVSRILDKLESKGILERKRRGMTNIIVLK